MQVNVIQNCGFCFIYLSLDSILSPTASGGWAFFLCFLNYKNHLIRYRPLRIANLYDVPQSTPIAQ
jgi:hypothetical protein